VSVSAVNESASDWANDFRFRAAKTRLPVSAMLELTGRCNLRCRHCYLGDQTQRHTKQNEELDTRTIIDSIEQWADAGCLYLTITGGDPLIRPDFHEIYRHAAQRGMLITVFCNATLVTDEIIELFRELPPRLVEVSIYGATPETYETVTQVPGSFIKAWTGIRRLRGNRFRLVLKTMILTINQHEVEAMASQAEAAGCDFRMDAAVFPQLSDGRVQPLELRVDPKVAVELDISSPERRKKWAENIERFRDPPKDGRLYQCGAGLTSFCLDSYGNYLPCLMAVKYTLSGRRGVSFMKMWNNELGEIQKRKPMKTTGDRNEEFRGACSSCPAMNYVETGDEETVSGYMKTIAQLRYQTVLEKENGKKSS